MKMLSEDFGKTGWALCVLFVVLAVCGCGGGAADDPQDTPAERYVYRAPRPTSDGWDITDAGELGLSVDLLEQMMNAVEARFHIVDSITIAYQGSLVLDETVRTATDEFDDWVGNNDPEIHVLFSASKSIASLAVGVAIDQGILGGLDTPYLEFFPYPSYANYDERKDRIVLEDVLTMRTGFEWNEWDPPYTSPDNRMLRFYDEEHDFSKALLDLPMANEPGTTFAYAKPATVSLGLAIENSGPLTLLDFGLNHILEPLEISDIEFLDTPTGLPDFGRGLYFRTRDFLKFGQLYLDGGTWNSTRVVIVPALDLVVAVNSHAWNLEEDELNQAFALISEFVLPALPAR